MDAEENILGKEEIGKLIRKFSVPCIISLLVNSLYNIVDQIFIGWGVGYLGNGATSIVFPITVICLAFALMFGDGSSAFLSLKLGEKKKEEAAKGVANGIISIIAISVTFCAIALIFMPQLVNLFGCTNDLRSYALEYGYAIAIGIPFMMIGTTLNSIIRADGNPKFAMTSMVTGAIMNVILDPIFIFLLQMGVRGAAIATVISQIITFVMNVLYIKKIKSVKLTKKNFEFDFNIAKKVSMLGISSFITQMSIVVVIAFENNLFAKYGATSKFGPEIPITVFGIVMKISQILNSMIIGVATGAQPILGYNYGAGKYDRVKKCLKIVLCVGLAISTLAFILFQTIPDKLILLFGSGDANYIEFACMAFRTYLVLCILNGFQIPAGIFFQAIGKSIKSAILSLTRQILLLIPSMLILGHLFGITGLLYSGPLADGIAFTIALIFIIREVRKLERKEQKEEKVNENVVLNNTLKEKVIITVAREYGSGGRYIGRLVANKLGIRFYDKEFIKRLAKETGMTEEYIEESEQRRNPLISLDNNYYGLSTNDELFIKETELVKKLAKKEACVIVGRCADFILKDNKNVIKVFIYSDEESKIKRVSEIYGLDKAKAKKEVKNLDKSRAAHYKYYTGQDWKNYSNYDICINSDTFGVEKSADMICEMVKTKLKEEKANKVAVK